jgi:hypothetical protein
MIIFLCKTPSFIDEPKLEITKKKKKNFLLDYLDLHTNRTYGAG